MFAVLLHGQWWGNGAIEYQPSNRLTQAFTYTVRVIDGGVTTPIFPIPLFSLFLIIKTLITYWIAGCFRWCPTAAAPMKYGCDKKDLTGTATPLLTGDTAVLV